MKLISWNVNGLRACLKKGFDAFFYREDADIFCVQETKLQPEQADFVPEGYHAYYSGAEKKGYSGTAVFAKAEPENVTYGLGIFEHDREGRVITLEYPNFFLVNTYTPNSQRDLLRLSYRVEWEDAFREYLSGLAARKHVIVCGDLNVAHREIDLKNPKSNVGNAGFTPEERRKFGELLEAGFIDSFRCLYPDKEGAYTWWSYMFKAREHNVGWRIDYFLVSDGLKDRITDSLIYSEVEGSDHCPVGLLIDLN